jgi:autotransporter-associated beta strand protein
VGTTLLFAKNNASTFNNSITGAGGVRLNTAAAVITLTNASYTGATQIQNGVLQSSSSTSNFALGTAGATFNYGILGLLADFTGPLGTAPGNVSWATGVNVSGGFAVMDAATRSINIGGNVVPDTLTVGSAGFVGGTLTGNNSRIAFGDINGTALGTVDFKNPINLGSGDRSLIMVVNGQAPFAADLTGAITGSGFANGTDNALVKFGNGNIRLSGTNTYTGRTIAGGQAAVILNSATAFSPNTWLHLDGGAAGTLGGILGLGYDLTADLGVTGGKVHLASSGGFAAFGANRSVTLNGGAALTWAATPSFVANAQNLILSQAKADATITLTNPIDLNDAERNIHVNNSPAVIDGSLSGALSNGSLRKSGPGTLALTGTSTYLGNTTILAGTLLVNGTLGETYTSVDTAGTLGGNGTLEGIAFVSGTLAPGESIGSLKVGFLALAGNFSYELNSTLNQGDLVHSNSGLDLQEGASLAVSDLSPATLPLGTKLTLISYGGFWNEGVFNYQGNPLPNGGSFSLGGNNWQIKYDDATGGPNFAADQAGAAGYVTLTTVESSASPYDTWAQGFGIDPQGPNGAPADDFDGDGTSNLAEFRLGLIPNSGSSRFDSTLTRNSLDGSVTLSWPSQPGLSFEVTSSTTLASFATAEATVAAADSPATTTTWTSGPQADPKKFFRVGFTPAP